MTAIDLFALVNLVMIGTALFLMVEGVARTYSPKKSRRKENR